MPRPERALDVSAGPLPRFAADLRELRRASGGLPYRQMARTANYSATVLSEAAAGRRLPTLAVTLAYVSACGGDQEEWQTRWQAVAADTGIEAVTTSAADAPSDTSTAVVERARPRRAVVLLAATSAVLLATVAVLAVLPAREAAVPVAPGGAMPEHMLAFNDEITEGDPVHDEPSPRLRCSALTAATACLDLANGLVWVRDLPPGDTHHAAGYWTTVDGTAHGECHNYLTAEGPWTTCPVGDLPDDARVRLRAAVVEKEIVLTWGPHLDVAGGR